MKTIAVITLLILSLHSFAKEVDTIQVGAMEKEIMIDNLCNCDASDMLTYQVAISIPHEGIEFLSGSWNLIDISEYKAKMKTVGIKFSLMKVTFREDAPEESVSKINELLEKSFILKTKY